jgi:hypothetical protein
MSDVLYGDDCPGVRGNTRKPKFGEWMRGVWASERNPQRDGMYVKTVRRTGRLNPGTWFELTDGKGTFYQYLSSETVFIDQPPLTLTDEGKTEHVAESDKVFADAIRAAERRVYAECAEICRRVEESHDGDSAVQHGAWDCVCAIEAKLVSLEPKP